MSRFTPLETGRLLLRRLQDDDLDALVRYRSLPEVLRYTPRARFDADDARATIAEMRDREPGVPGTWFQVAVVERGSDVLVGDLGLRTDAVQPDTYEIGYTFSPDHQGRGYATEAVRALLGFVFGALGAHRVYGNCDARNLASARVMARVGLRLEAHHVEDWWSKGEWTSSLVYAVLAREWAERAQAANPRSPGI